MPGSVRTLLMAVLPAVAVMVVYALVTSGTSSDGGRVPIPGQRMVSLEKGSNALYYEERRNLEEGSGTPGVDDADFLEIPTDLRVGVRGEGGRSLQVRRTAFGSVVEDEDGSRKVFAKVEVPRAGRYRIVAGRIARDAPSPAVTVGSDALEEFIPWAAGAVGAAAIGALLSGIIALRRRRRRLA